MYTLAADSLSKRFGSRKVFAGVTFELNTGESLAVVGPNGSGKTTLLMLLLGLHHPTRGQVKCSLDGKALNVQGFRSRASLVSPYLNLYDHLTGEENLSFFATLSGVNLTGKEINELLGLVGLEGRGVDRVVTYSSGMKQRLKYAVALLKDPSYLILDEPTANLDTDGKQIVKQIIENRREQSIIVLATNEKEEYSLADGTFQLDQ